MGDPARAEQKFLEFEWEKSQEWRAYFGNLHPTPPMSLIPKYKRKWFRRHVDSNLGVENEASADATGGTATPQAEYPHSSHPSHPSHPPTGSFRSSKGDTGTSKAIVNSFSVSLVLHLLTVVFAILYLIPLVGSPKLQRYSVLCSVAANLTYALAKVGRPRFSEEYLSSFLLDDSGQALCMALINVAISETWIMLVSPVMTSVLSLAEICKHRYSYVSSLGVARYPVLNKFTEEVNSQRYRLMQKRADFELTAGLILLFLMFVVRSVSFIQVIMYWSVLRMKCLTSGFTKSSFSKLDAKIMSLLQKQFVPDVLRRGYEAIRNFLRTLGPTTPTS